MEKLIFFGDDLARRYHRKLQRIPIDLALGCPNRRDRYGEGCVFCSENGSRARHLSRHLDLPEQVAAGRRYVRERYGVEGPYIAYFQSFTSTYAPVERLREWYDEVLACADFPVVIVGTRPDALPPETIDWLRELNEHREVWVELGVQTAHDRTLELIRRGHDFAAVREAIRALDAAGIRCGAHVILGLPGETAADFAVTAQELGRLPFQAVKLHQLQVLRGTELARWWSDPAAGVPVRPLNEYEYAAAAAAFLRALPEGWQIMRLCADADPEEVLAPQWWMKKGQFLDFFRRYFAEGGTEIFPGVVTADGSKTLYHPEFRQHFHSVAGAAGETQHKFLEPTRLGDRLKHQACVRVLDVGFGLGVNAGAAVQLAETLGQGRLEVVSLELDRRTLAAAVPLYEETSWMRHFLEKMLADGEYESRFAECRLVTGDARQTLPGLEMVFDVVFQDAFSPDCNPELWTLDWFREIRRHLAEGGVLATYSSAYPVRGALWKLGFGLGTSAPFGRRRGGTVACRDRRTPEGVEPLSQKEFNILLHSTAGTPYRDPDLHAERARILSRHEALVRRLRRLGVPKWFRN